MINDDNDECGIADGMKIGKEYQNIERKPASVFVHHKSHIT
jgi:hypothetical protein